MRGIYSGGHVCMLPALNRRWQNGQVYACTCNNLFRVREYADCKAFEYIGKVKLEKESK